MSGLTLAGALLLYASAAVLVVGVAAKIGRYLRVPAPLKIPTTPAPLNHAGVGWRMVKEVVFFTSLFKATKWTWLFGWIFHAALLVVLLGHLRYFIDPVWAWVAQLQGLGQYAALLMMLGLVGLWGRRVLVDRVRYVSSLSDHLMLWLLIAIAGTGFLMRTVSHIDVVGLKAFVLGLVYFDWHPLPGEPVLLLHLGLVAVLMLVFPFSKLLHAPGLFFSPTRNQADNPRERRHLARWAAELESDRGR